MLDQKITKIANGQFKIDNVQTVKSLILNFNLLLKEIKETLNFEENILLLHFQGQPKKGRRWGIYDPQKDVYKSFEALHKHIFKSVDIILFQVKNEENKNFKPTAVIIFHKPSFNIESIVNA